MAYSSDKITSAIVSALDCSEIPGDKRQEIAFHMTDWLHDLEGWHSFCSDPDSFDAAQLRQLITNFLVHVPNHVAAAKKLYLGDRTRDVFKVGLFDDYQ